MTHFAKFRKQRERKSLLHKQVGNDLLAELTSNRQSQGLLGAARK